MKGADVYLSLSGRCGDEAERLFVDAAQRAGARDVFVVNSLYAAARGCSLKGSGDSLIIDIGYETASMAAYSRGKEAAVSHSEFAGAAFDRAIISYVMKKYHMSLTHEEFGRNKKRDRNLGSVLKKNKTDIRVMLPCRRTSQGAYCNRGRDILRDGAGFRRAYRRNHCSCKNTSF